ncbi:hypothetical protein E1267_41835 [Nonomuraea longispora]|uniref:Uncharacterized protein n=1 Tax=Nonomuraea longispora TaxID=1848320 RepID=A0A4R4MIC1_9ACTN|nr:replication initiator [Nonomuraea longispora]TDB95504.1 hypothetical protein E1267_41835 [Nonomuraea longispora]
MRELLRVSYVKVAESQKRGVVHLHVLARLDGVNPDDPDQVIASPAWADANLLTAALAHAAARRGRQLDVRPIQPRELDRARVAGYLAKYATKTLSDSMSGLPASRPRTDEPGLDEPRTLPAHVAALTATVRRLARLGTCRINRATGL